jgi:hypothetical protein
MGWIFGSAAEISILAQNVRRTCGGFNNNVSLLITHSH